MNIVDFIKAINIFKLARWTTDAAGNPMGLMGPSGAETVGLATSIAGLCNMVVMGDSMTAGNSENASITAISRSSGVVTATLAGHLRGTGEICRIYNCLDTSFNANAVAVTRVDANTFTYASPGADGSTTNMSGTKAMQLMSPAWQHDNGYLFWLNSKFGGALKLVMNAGCNGQTSVDMLARYSTDVLPYQTANVVVILTGYNDWAVSSYTAAQVYANVVAMAQQSYGKLVVIVSSLPWTTGGTAANRAEAIKYNRMIRAFCNSTKNVRYADAAKYLIDATNVTKFSPLTGMLQSDGIHPSPKGAERLAQAIYDAVQYDIPRVSRLVSCSGDNYGADNTNANIMDAAPWTTSGGALAGGATGTAATGIAVTNTGGGTVVASVVSRSDLGYDQQAVFTPSADNDSVTFSGAGYISGRTADGQKLNYLGQLVLSGMSGANIKSVDVYLTYASANAFHYLAKAQAVNAASYPGTDMTINLASLVDSVICTAHTGVGWNIVIKASASGSALTAKLGLQSIEKV